MTDGLKDAHREAIIAAIAANDRVERAVLFGSRATGTNTVTSDVDIALFGDRLTLTDLARLSVAIDEIPMAQSVDLLLYNSIQDRTLRSHVRQRGAEWYARRSPVERYDFSPSRGCSGDWVSLQLGAACTKIGSGATPRGGKDVYLPNGPYALIRSQNVLNEGFRHEGLAYIGQQHASDLAGVEVRRGDVLLNITGDSVARVCQVDASILPARVNQHVAIIRPDAARLDPRFLRYSLVDPTTQAKLLSWAASGGTRNALTKGMIEAIDVKAPAAVSEQRAIAHILGALDDKIELNRRMNETLEAMARALFKSWFVDFDPVRAKMEGRDTGLPRNIADLFPDRLVDSEMGEIPEGWEVSEVGKEVDAVGGSTPSTKEPSYWLEGQRYWATPKDLSKLLSPVLLDTSRKITDAGLQKISSGTLPVGTVLMSSRAPIGYLAIAEVPTAVNQGFIAMKCEKRLPNLYVLYWCHHNLGHIKDIAGGSTFPEISKKAFRPISVLVPSEPILQAFERLSHPLYGQLVVNMKQSATLATLRDTLLPKLISGEIRVPTAERLVESVP